MAAISVLAAEGPSWQALGPFGGAAEAIALDPVVPGRLMAAARNGLLYRSDDAGKNWRSLPFPHEVSSVVHALAVSPRRAATYYVALSNPGGCGLYRSADAGQTWEAPPDLCKAEVFALAVSSSNPDVLAAGCRDGVYLTLDGGDSWSRISPRENLELQPVVSVAIDPDNAAIYAGTPHLPWRTTDRGKTWQSIHNGMIDDSDVFSLGVDPRSPQHIFASACSGIYFSRDRGSSWTKVLGVPRTSRRTYTIRQDPAEPLVFYAGTSSGLWKSLDAGSHWRQVSPLIVKSIAFDPQDAKRLFMASENEGIVTSADGAETTQAINAGFFHRKLSALVPAENGMFAVSVSASGGGELIRYSGPRDRWEAVGGPAGAAILSVAFAGRATLVSTYNRIFRSTDGGRRWEVTAMPWKTARVESMFAMAGAPPVVLAATRAGLYRTEDLGSTWHAVGGFPVAAGEIAIYGSPVREAPVLAQFGEELFRSADRGRTWTRAALPAHASDVYRMAPTGSDVVLGATTRGLYRSTDGALTWRMVAGALSGGTVSDVIVDPASAQVFAVQHSSVYESHDGGDTWTPVSAPGLERCSVRSLAIDPSSPTDLFALTHAKGVFVLHTGSSQTASYPARPAEHGK